MATAQDIIQASLREIGVLAAGEVASADDANDALGALNRLIDQDAAERLQIFTTTRTIVDLENGRGEYLLGPGDDPTFYSDNWATDSEFPPGPEGWVVERSNSSMIITTNTPILSELLLNNGGLVPGSATVRRDFLALPSRSGTVSIASSGETGEVSYVTLQNLQSLKYMDSSGVWHDALTRLLTVVPDGSGVFVTTTVDFELDEDADIGSYLRLTIYYTGGANEVARYKSGSLTAEGKFYILAFDGTTDCQIPRPVYLSGVSVLVPSASPPTEIPLGAMTDDLWELLPQKELASTLPTAYYYNPTMPKGTLNIWPAPDADGLQVAIYVPTQVAQFQSISDTFSMPPAYERMYVKNLALDLCPSYDRQPNPLLVEQARDARATVKRSNYRLSDMGFPGGASIGPYNGYWGTSRFRSGP